MSISYEQEDNVPFAEYLLILQSSGLAERRPTDIGRLAKMLTNSNFCCTARDDGGKLIGLVRCFTDFGHTCYVADFATDKAVQGQGIGKRLMRLVEELLGPEVTILLLSAPKAEGFYERLGMERSKRAFTFSRQT